MQTEAPLYKYSPAYLGDRAVFFTAPLSIDYEVLDVWEGGSQNRLGCFYRFEGEVKEMHLPAGRDETGAVVWRVVSPVYLYKLDDLGCKSG